MNPGNYFVRSWIPGKNLAGPFPNQLTIYDAGNFQGWLFESSLGKSTWVVFQIDGRVQEDLGYITEFGTIVPEWEAPLHYFSKTTYPMRQQEQGSPSQILFSLPQMEILLTVSLLSLEALLPTPSEALPPPPLPQQQQTPSPRPARGVDAPVSRGPPKSSSSRPVGAQQRSQNKNRASPTSKALSSSNQGRRAPPSGPTPTKQAVHQQSQPLEHHTDHESSEHPLWTSLAQQSLYSRPPPELAKELSAQASTSQSPKGSEQS